MKKNLKDYPGVVRRIDDEISWDQKLKVLMQAFKKVLISFGYG